MILKPWREIAEPHSDVREGKFQQAEFAADLWQVHAGTANEEYQNPVLFFQRTFITEGMRLLLDSVVKRLAGKGGDPGEKPPPLVHQRSKRKKLDGERRRGPLLQRDRGRPRLRARRAGPGRGAARS